MVEQWKFNLWCIWLCMSVCSFIWHPLDMPNEVSTQMQMFVTPSRPTSTNTHHWKWADVLTMLVGEKERKWEATREQKKTQSIYRLDVIVVRALSSDEQYKLLFARAYDFIEHLRRNSFRLYLVCRQHIELAARCYTTIQFSGSIFWRAKYSIFMNDCLGGSVRATIIELSKLC